MGDVFKKEDIERAMSAREGIDYGTEDLDPEKMDPVKWMNEGYVMLWKGDSWVWRESYVRRVKRPEGE